jgi:hypothetical protein
MRHYISQALLDVGKPAAGASITVFLPGTTTKATIYSDDGVTAKSNPFTADSYGHFDFYASSAKYDISIAAAGGQTGYTLTGEVIFDPFEATSADMTLVNNQILPLNTSGLGGIWAVALFATGWQTQGLQISSANEVRVQQFILPFRVQIGKVSYSVTSVVASTIADLGIYDINGNRLANAGGFSTATLGNFTTPLQNAPITLNAGIYYFAQTCSSSTPTMTHITDFGVGTFANTSGSKIRGVAATPSSSGVLPATLGTISINNNLQGYVMAYLER